MSLPAGFPPPPPPPQDAASLTDPRVMIDYLAALDRWLKRLAATIP